MKADGNLPTGRWDEKDCHGKILNKIFLLILAYATQVQRSVVRHVTNMSCAVATILENEKTLGTKAAPKKLIVYSAAF